MGFPVDIVTQMSYWKVHSLVVRRDLDRDGDYWEGTVPEVEAGQMYRFEIQTSAAGTIQRLDPAGRDVLSSDLTRQELMPAPLRHYRPEAARRMSKRFGSKCP